jgi:hypothetical protein
MANFIEEGQREPVREKAESVPTIIENEAVKIRSTNWGGIAATYIETQAQVDFTPILKGLPGDLCPSPHWGYILKGSAHLIYPDGTEEDVQEGDMFYWPAPHTGSFAAGSKILEFNPADEYQKVVDHVLSGGTSG